MDLKAAKERLTEAGLRAREGIDGDIFGGIPSPRGPVLLHGFLIHRLDEIWIVDFADDGQISIPYKHKTLEEATQTVTTRLKPLLVS